MKGYPLRINSIDGIEDYQKVGCAVEESLISNGQFFVQSRPNSRKIGVTPIFQLINGVREQTSASLAAQQAEMVIIKNN